MHVLMPSGLAQREAAGIVFMPRQVKVNRRGWKVLQKQMGTRKSQICTEARQLVAK